MEKATAAARLLNTTDQAVREKRHALDIRPVYKRADTCAAEFAAKTTYPCRATSKGL
jgi:carbamoyl-phosphate synthase large subunit